MDCPIIFIHQGASSYLSYSLAQARIMNPDASIVLIGDAENDLYDFVEHIDIRHLEHSASAFDQYYKHKSPNGEFIERWCFRRWFILRLFLGQHNLTSCLHLDSDIMLYLNAEEAHSRYSQFHFTISNGRSPHCCFVNGLDSLDQLCDSIKWAYTTPDGLDWLQSEYERINNVSSGGICDMTFFERYSNTFPETCLDLSVVREGAVFDDNINASNGFVMRDGIKEIRFLDGYPYGHSAEQDLEVQFKTLHFQGSKTKMHMARFLTRIGEGN